MSNRGAVLVAWLAVMANVASAVTAQPDTPAAEPKPAAKDATPAEPKPATDPLTKPPTIEEKPAVGEEGIKPLVIKVTVVKGQVQVRMAADQPWQAAKPGTTLAIGAEVRTGLRSACQFTIDGNHTITLDRLGTITVLDAIRRDGRVKTDVGMKYGRTQYKVESNAAEHDSKIHAPAATLAVRGSFVIVEDNLLYGSVAIVNESRQSIYTPRIPGTLPGSTAAMRIMAIELVTGRVEQPLDKAGRPDSPTEVAMRDTISDLIPAAAQVSELERDLIAKYPIYNGAGGTGVADIRKIIDQVVDTPSPAPTFTTGFLNIFVTSASNNITLFAVEPGTGIILSTTPGNPPGSVNTVRNNTSFASASTFPFPLNVHYGQTGNDVPVGTYQYFIKLDSGTSANFDVQVHRGFPAAGSLVLKDFSGSVSVGNPIFSDSFSVQPTPAP